jgi:hypothetical protein
VEGVTTSRDVTSGDRRVVRTICFGRKRLLDRGTFLRAAVRWSVPDFLPADFFLRVVFFFVAMRWSLSGGIGRCGRKTLAASRGPGSPISDGTAFSRNPWTVSLLKSPFLLRQSMLRPAMDTLLGDEIVAPDPPDVGPFARRTSARSPGVAAPTAGAAALTAAALAARENGPLPLGFALAHLVRMANGDRDR